MAVTIVALIGISWILIGSLLRARAAETCWR
jgi:hypothetical protein